MIAQIALIISVVALVVALLQLCLDTVSLWRDWKRGKTTK